MMTKLASGSRGVVRAFMVCSIRTSLVHICAFAGTVAVMLLLLAPAAHADPITTFNLTSTFPSAVGAAYGTITIDVATGVVESILLSFVGEPGDTIELGSDSDLEGSGSDAQIEFSEEWTLPDNGFYAVNILLPVNTLVGYEGGAICSTSNPCSGGELSGFAYGDTAIKPYSSGDLSVTPEPASWMLVSTGILGSFMILYRRQRYAAEV